MTNEDILTALGAARPLLLHSHWREDGNGGAHHETLTEEGETAFDKLRQILNELQQRGVTRFNEDALDEMFFGVGQ